MLGAQSKKPQQARLDAVSLVFRPYLVAGAGFEPTTWVMSPIISVRICSDLERVCSVLIGLTNISH